MNTVKLSKSISFVIPTLNAEKTLRECLNSIINQDYPREKMEIVIVDAGSKDKTLDIFYEYKNIYKDLRFILTRNPNKTTESGKSVGVKESNNEIIALVDGDNILDGKDWLKKMTAPFEDAEVVASEPLYFSYRKEDCLLVRYFALLGMNDPICLFLGNYDRYCYLTGKWTELEVTSIDNGDYLIIELEKNNIPTIGANGFLVRKKYVLETNYQPYLFDLDMVYQMVENGHRKFAKVKLSIIHLFADKIGIFAKKQKRRIMDYLFYKKNNLRFYPWQKINRKGLVKFVLYSFLVIPLLMETLKGYSKVRDKAWFFHPLACWITLYIYTQYTLRGIFKTNIFDRNGW